MTQTIPNKQQVKMSQVWAQLGREHRAGIIQLMAQLVVKMMVEQNETVRKEVRDGAGT
ncbi:MAG: hypothetical protein H8E29_16175 [Anaerolineales bacterium]|uniref:Uncharacterized protein n=1 Tax=Candidatus Desulfolinea nitratireducens TaxID=2841698 RepID=A0A8J6NKS7_9CHLR|nr:hypothetical protein [Candidatus Desulfolinea nitratireducens]